MPSASDVRGSVDFGILTVRADEYTAVLGHLPRRETVQGRAFYEFSRVSTAGGGQAGVAVARCLEQGQGAAHDAARDLIDDLDPRWILLVGIAGGVPDDDYSLGDVLLASRVYDFSVSAEIQDGEVHRREWSSAGGSVHPQVARVLAAIPGWQDKFKGWSRRASVGMKKPGCAVPADADSGHLYGPGEWRAKVRGSLARNFPAGRRPRPPRYAVIPVGSGDVLVKDTALVAEWRQSARALGFVEMEAGGVYRAARRPEREYPVLVVRGLSDVVGFKRDAAWTAYACRSAAAFAAAFVQAGVINGPLPQALLPPRPEQLVIRTTLIRRFGKVQRKYEDIGKSLTKYRTQYKVRIFLDGPSDQLDLVDKVEYELDESFARSPLGQYRRWSGSTERRRQFRMEPLSA
jgi:nucleoside phosphorylase